MGPGACCRGSGIADAFFDAVDGSGCLVPGSLLPWMGPGAWCRGSASHFYVSVVCPLIYHSPRSESSEFTIEASNDAVTMPSSAPRVRGTWTLPILFLWMTDDRIQIDGRQSDNLPCVTVVKTKMFVFVCVCVCLLSPLSFCTPLSVSKSKPLSSALPTPPPLAPPPINGKGRNGREGGT